MKTLLEKLRALAETEKQATAGLLRVGDSRVMCDRTPNDPTDMHWPIFWEDCGCGMHVFRKEDATLFADSRTLLKELLESWFAHHAALEAFADGSIDVSGTAVIIRGQGRMEAALKKARELVNLATTPHP